MKIEDAMTQLDALERDLPKMRAESKADSDFWLEFAGRADVIEDSVSPEDFTRVRDRIDDMLARHDLQTREDEPA